LIAIVERTCRSSSQGGDHHSGEDAADVRDDDRPRDHQRRDLPADGE
jgi:hypothetical protein